MASALNDAATAALVDSAGGVLVGGANQYLLSSRSDVVLARLHADGTLDTGYTVRTVGNTPKVDALVPVPGSTDVDALITEQFNGTIGFAVQRIPIAGATSSAETNGGS